MEEEFFVNPAGTGYASVEKSIISYAKGIGLVQFKNDIYQLGADIKRYQVF